MSNLFGRKVELINGSRKFSGDSFTIYFSVPFDDGTESNVSEIEIYNLKNSTINGIKKGSNIILNAGYTDNVGSILLGMAKQIETNPSGVDKVTTIDVIEGSEKWFDTEINKTYKKNTTGKQILNDLLSKAGLKVGVLNLPTNKVYKSGKAVKAKLPEAIAEVVKDCGAKIHVTRGKVYIRPKNEGDKSNIIIDSEHGLVGSPTPIEKEEKYTVVEKVKVQKKVKEKRKPGQKGKLVTKTVPTLENKNVEKTRVIKGWKVVTLLNHRITTDVIVTIKSKTAKGSFRVESGKHEGKGSTFVTEMEVYPT